MEFLEEFIINNMEVRELYKARLMETDACQIYDFMGRLLTLENLEELEEMKDQITKLDVEMVIKDPESKTRIEDLKKNAERHVSNPEELENLREIL
jgi:hypothetical protein